MNKTFVNNNNPHQNKKSEIKMPQIHATANSKI